MEQGERTSSHQPCPAQPSEYLKLQLVQTNRKVLVERDSLLGRSSLGHGKGHSKDGVGTCCTVRKPIENRFAINPSWSCWEFHQPRSSSCRWHPGRSGPFPSTLLVRALPSIAMRSTLIAGAIFSSTFFTALLTPYHNSFNLSWGKLLDPNLSKVSRLVAITELAGLVYAGGST